MVDILDEAREAHQQERMLALVKRYGSFLLMGALAAIVFVGGKQFWQHREAKAAQADSVLFFGALEQAAQGQRQIALAQLEELSQKGSGAYRDLALLQRAAMLKDDGKKPEMLVAYRALQDNASDPLFKAVAELELAEAEGKAAELSDKKGPLQYSRWQLLALDALARKDLVKAKDYATRLSTDPQTPSSLRDQAEIMLLQISRMGGA